MIVSGDQSFSHRILLGSLPSTVAPAFPAGKLWPKLSRLRLPAPHAVMVGLDPTISRTPHIDGIPTTSCHCAEIDARVRPEHDEERATARQNENCWKLSRFHLSPPAMQN